MMQPLLWAADVAEVEARLFGAGLSEDELMLRAGTAVAAQVEDFLADGVAVVMCGMGKNGGDGWVVADVLASHGREVAVVCAATPALLRDEVSRRMAAHAVEMGVPVHVNPDDRSLEALLEQADVVVDALFGTGFRGELPAPYAQWADAVEQLFCGIVVAIDVPSGVQADTGSCTGACMHADVTVTMFACKPGLVSGAGRACAGDVAVAHLASPAEGMPDLDEFAGALLVTDGELAEALPAADDQADKYGRGHVLVVAGSGRYPGAAIMAARAASRSGAGYVTLAVPQGIVPCARMHLLDIPVVGLPEDDQGSLAPEAADEVRALSSHADAVLVGPGLTTSFGACETVRALLEGDRALVLDADALNAAVKICLGSVADNPSPLRRTAPLVLTPHRRELARLMGPDGMEIASLAEAVACAQRLAWSVGSSDLAVVAKGPETAVVGVDAALVVTPGPAALATAGTGDVLAGMVAGTLAGAVAAYGIEGIASSELLCMVAAVDRAHSIAGELAAGVRGSRGVVASDLLDLVGNAFDAFAAAAARQAEELGLDDDDGSEADLSAGPANEDSGDLAAVGGLPADKGTDDCGAVVVLPADLTLAEPSVSVSAGIQTEVGAGDVRPFVPASPLVRRAAAPSPSARESSLPDPAQSLGLEEPSSKGRAPDVARDVPASRFVPSVDDAPRATVPPFLVDSAPPPEVVTALDVAPDAVDDFHERATILVDDGGAPAIADRPSARGRRPAGHDKEKAHDDADA